MSKKSLSATNTARAIAQLADPDVNLEVAFASTSRAAHDIIRSLPAVRRLKRGGPETEKAVLSLLADRKTRKDKNLTAIALDILRSYPSADVKNELARLISRRKFRGINNQLAAETFLKAAGIKSLRTDAVKVARQEAQKTYTKNLQAVAKVEYPSKGKRPLALSTTRRSVAAKK